MNQRFRARPTRATIELATLLGSLFGIGIVLSGCATGPIVSASPSASVAKRAPDTARDRNDPVAIEQQWLLSFFSGTPVAIERSDDGALTITVPAEFCFDARSAVIKPPLEKVLEKLAQSLRRRPLFTVATVEAPAEAPNDSGLALRRARAVQQRLRTLGVDPRRFARVGTATAAELRLQLRSDSSPG